MKTKSFDHFNYFRLNYEMNSLSSSSECYFHSILLLNWNFLVQLLNLARLSCEFLSFVSSFNRLCELVWVCLWFDFQRNFLLSFVLDGYFLMCAVYVRFFVLLMCNWMDEFIYSSFWRFRCSIRSRHRFKSINSFVRSHSTYSVSTESFTTLFMNVCFTFDWWYLLLLLSWCQLISPCSPFGCCFSFSNWNQCPRHVSGIDTAWPIAIVTA